MAVAFAYRSQEQEEIKMRGKVKWFADEKGYGFISPEDGSKDIFVHHTAIIGEGFRSLAENDAVEFEVEQSPKGQRASRVRKV